MLEEAEAWHNLGFNVVAMRVEKTGEKVEKKPLASWGEWQSRRQSKEEFLSQPWEQASGFAVVLDWPGEDGRYLTCVDFDVKNVSEDAVIKGKKALNMFPKTRVEKTVSGGLHYFYFTRVKPRSISFHDTHALELLAQGRLVVLAPSEGYEVVENRSIEEMGSVEELFRRAVDHLEVEKREAGLRQREAEERLKQAQEFITGEIEKEEAKPAKHKKTEEAGEAEEEGKPVFKISGFAEEGPYEAIMHENQPRFLVYSNNEFKILAEVHEDGVVVYPPDPKNYPYPPYEWVEDLPDPRQLGEDIIAEFRRFIDVGETDRKRWSVEVILTYLQDKLLTVPYELLLGPEGVGKTVVETLFSHLAYRPLFAVSLPAADVYSFLQQHPLSTIIEDEATGIEKDLEKMKITLSGYKAGAKVPRTTVLQNGTRVINYFPTFGFKVFACRNLVNHPAFQDRCIITKMVEGDPEKTEIDETDIERFKNIRNRLLKLRLMKIGEALPEAGEEIKGRMGELWRPLIRVAKAIGLEEWILESYGKHWAEYRRAREESLEAVVFKSYLYAVIASGCEWISSDQLFEALKTIMEGKEDDKKPGLYHTSDFGDVTKLLLGRRLGENLGGERKTLRQSSRVVKAWTIPKQILLKQVHRYICDQVRSLDLLGQRVLCDCLSEDCACSDKIRNVDGKCRFATLFPRLKPEERLLQVSEVERK